MLSMRVCWRKWGRHWTWLHSNHYRKACVISKSCRLRGLLWLRTRPAFRNRLQTQTVSFVVTQSRARLALVSQQLADIDAEITTRITAEKSTARTRQIIRSIPGIGAVSAAAILIEMPEIGTLNRKQTASLAGLAPMTRQSGTWTGQAFIQGGRHHLRQALYMPALVAMRFNPDLKAKYQALRAAGKPAKVAITVLMRKLIVMANERVKADRLWAPQRPCARRIL